MRLFMGLVLALVCFYAKAYTILYTKPEHANTYIVYVDTMGMPSYADLWSLEQATLYAAEQYTDDPTSNIEVVYGGVRDGACEAKSPGSMQVCFVEGDGKAIATMHINNAWDEDGRYYDSPSLRFDLNNSFQPTLLNHEEELCVTIMHEMGHALGLDHEDGVSSIMGTGWTSECKLYEDDRNALQLLYPNEGRSIPLECALKMNEVEFEDESKNYVRMAVHSVHFNGKTFQAETEWKRSLGGEYFNVTYYAKIPQIPGSEICEEVWSFNEDLVLEEFLILDRRDGEVYLYDLYLNLKLLRLEVLSKKRISNTEEADGVTSP